VLVVSLITLGSPAEVTGGHLYHRRMAEAAAARGARIDFVSAGLRNPLSDALGIVLVDSLAAWSVAPWAVLQRQPRHPLAAILHQPPGGIGQGVVRTAIQRPADKLLYQRCDLLIAASTALSRDLIDRHGLPAERICIVEPGSDMPLGAAPAGDLRAGRRMALLCIGNWLPNKGILELLEAVAALPAGDLTLHLVGRTDVDARYTSRLRDLLDCPDLAGRVVVHGPLAREVVAGMYASADVFALPSYVETYGTVFAEALTAGVPTVGWRSGNLPHLIENGKQGCLVEPGDTAGLSRVLHRLASDDDWRAALAVEARRRGASLPTWSDTADEFFAAISRLQRAHG
jgi:glycosyltransferase involved in cell wall biosynthesis